MQMQDDDLRAFITRSQEMARRNGRSFNALLIPANVELTDTQREWMKRNGVGQVEQNGKVVTL